MDHLRLAILDTKVVNFELEISIDIKCNVVGAMNWHKCAIQMKMLSD